MLFQNPIVIKPDRLKETIEKKKRLLQPGVVIVNAYTLIAVLYCAFSAILFYYVVENIFLAVIHLLSLLTIVMNYFILVQTKKFNRATNIILTTGTIVVISLFATGGWANTGYLWPFAYLPFAFFLSDRAVIMNWVAALFGGCLIVVLLHFIGTITIPYSPAALVNYFAALLIFIVCIFLFQKATVKREEFLSYTETLLEAAPDPVIVIDDEGRIVKWNAKSETLFGSTADEVCGKLLSETIIPHRFREAHKKGLEHFLKTGEEPVLDKTIEIQAINKNNVEFDVALSISPAVVQGKRLFIGFVRDITERKETEEKMKESEKMFSTLFYKSPVLKAIIEASTGKYIEVNDAFVDFLGDKKEDILGKTSIEINMLGDPEERDQIIKDIQKNGCVRELELQLNSRDGKASWVSTNVDIVNLNGKDCFLSAGIDITKRKIAEENLLTLSQELEEIVLDRTQELNRREKSYRYLFENNPMPMWVIDLDTFKFLDVNEMAIQQYGYSREEFFSMTTLDIRPDEDKELFKQSGHLSEMNTSNYSRGIWNHRKKDGTVIQAEVIAHQIIFEGVQARLVLSNDVTERKKAEEKLNRNEKRFRALVENNEGIIALLDENFKTIYRTPSSERITGWTPDERKIVALHEQIHPDDTLYLNDILKEALANPGKPFDIMIRTKHKKGHYIWLEGVITNMIHEPAVGALVTNFRDITERKILEEQQALFASIVNSSDDAIFSKTLDGKVNSWNHGAEKVFGYSSNEIIGNPSSILIPPHLQNEENGIMEKIHKGEGVDHYETERIRKDGKSIYVSLTISPIKDSLGNITGASKILRDITEQKKAGENLQKSLREISDYKYALDESSIVAITDQKGIIKHVNDNFCKISKYTREELVGKDHRIINSGYHPKEFIRNLWVTIANGKIWEGELKNNAKDGTVYWVDTTIIPFLNDEGKPYQYVAIKADITERKQAEQALHESQQLLLAIIDNSAAVIYVKNLEGQYLLANRRFAELFHLSEEAILGKTDYDFFSKGEADAFREMDVRTAAADEALVEEEIVPLDDGPHTYISVKSALRNDKGKPYAIFGISTDITERKKAEDAIKLAEANYREISDKSSDAIYVYEIETGKVIEVNNRAYEITGYTGEELLNADPQEFITDNPNYTLLHAVNYLQKAVAGEPQLFEWLSKNKDGSHNWLEVNLKKATIAGQERILSFFREINDRKKAQLEIQKLNEELEQKVTDRTEQLETANKELEAFSYSVSHDLRAPLRAINGFAKILGENYSDALDNEGTRLFIRIKENARKMGLLIDNLLEFSRLGRKEIHKSPIQMTRLVEAALLEINTTISHEAAVKIHQLHSANADNTMIKQVMINLLSNAIKYSSKTEKPSIVIKSQLKENEIIYSVSDNGVGFNNQFVHKLFGVFQRLHLQADFEGTGVGLALVKRIVNKHGGRVWAAGELNKGATFSFSLPAGNKN